MAAYRPAADERAPYERAISLPATLDRATPTVLHVYRRAWLAVTRAVLGMGIAVLAALTLLLLPVIAAVMIVGGLVFRRDIGEFIRSSMEEVEAESRVIGLVALAVASGLGWHVLLGSAGVAVVLVDILGGVPLLLTRGVGRPARVEGRRQPHHSEPSGGRDGGDLGDLLADADDPDDTRDDTGNAELVRPRQPLDDDLGHLSDVELRHAWNASSRALLMVDDAATRLRIVAARARYLEAMEQRDPQWFAQWARSALRDSDPPDDLPDLDGRQ